MKRKVFTITGLLTLLLALIQWPVLGETAVPGMAQRTFTPADFVYGSGEGFVVTEKGLLVAETAVTSIYTSPAISAPIPFNVIVPEWHEAIPDGGSLEIALRSHAGDGQWTAWQSLHENDDWMEENDDTLVGDMFLIPDLHATHAFVQFRVSLGRYTGTATPILHDLTLVFIDTSDAPTTEEALAQQQALDAAQGIAPEAVESFPKPSVISRQVWCPYPGYDPQDCFPPVTYYPVSHLILHHTVSNNTYSPSQSLSIVQAIWRYHTYTRGWGDIGYQYLVDLYGVAFEGHYGGDNVVGTHASGANKGSMAVSLIGNFEQTMPPPSGMWNKAADLFAWKADQRGINVYEASRALPDIPWGLPTLMGHRDVYGGNLTACPGSDAFALMPQLRQMVAQRIGLVDPHIYVDEMSSGFVKSNANWYVAPGGCGHNNHAYYTWSTTDPSLAVNWGEWRPTVPQTGWYKIQVYAPYCNTGSAETTGARYTVTHRNGVNTVVVNQDADVGLWMTLGNFELNAGTGNAVRLTDLTTTDDDKGVWFDAIRLLPLTTLPPEGTAVLTAPAANVWFNNRTVQFNWSFSEPNMVAGARLRAAADPGFSNVVVDQSWGTAVTSASHTFGQDYANLYWQVIMTSVYGNQIASEVRRFGIDTTPPESVVDGIYQREGRTYFVIGWSGSDAHSGIARYNVQYRKEGTATWVNWLSNTTHTAATFAPPETAVYWFRSQAIDNLGNIEAYQADGDMNTTQATMLTRDIFMPLIHR